MAVYDDEKEKLTPGALKAAEEKGDQPAVADDNEANKLSGLDDQVGKGFNPADTSRIGRLLNASLSGGKRNRNLLIGGGVGAGIVALIISLFLALLPLKINHIVENLQKRFFASTASATNRWSDKLFSNYIKKYILPNLGSNCAGGTVNKNCINAFNVQGNSPAARLYQGWKDARLENTLAEKYGIAFEKQGQNFKLKVTGNPDINIDGGFLKDNRDLSDVVGGRNDVRQKWRTALDDETKFTKILYRFKVGRLLERKYGIKRCVFACKIQDNFADWKDNKTKAAQVVLSERILQPRSEYMALLFECITVGGCEGAGSQSADGERRDKFQEELAQKLASFEERFGAQAVETLVKDAQTVSEKGFSAYLVERVAATIGGDAAGAAAGKAVPVVGYVNAVSSFIGKAEKLGPRLKKWGYILGATSMVSYYMMYRSHADELKSGHVDPQLLGSMVSALGDNAGDNDHKNQPAEVSPLYGELLGSGSSPTQSALLDLLSPTAYAEAQTQNSQPKYTCDDNTQPADGKFICPEESLVIGGAATTFSDLFKKPPLNAFAGLADFWNATLGRVINLVTGIIGSILQEGLKLIPGYNAIVSTFEQWAKPLIEGIIKFLIPSPFSDKMSGARSFNMMAGGADVSGNDYAQYGLGGQALSAQQAADIRNQQEAEARQEFVQQPLWQRLFNKDSQYSLVSQVAMMMPTSRQTGIQNSLSNLLANPFVKLTGAFRNILASPYVHAAASTPDPFGITQYGYPTNSSAFNIDPDNLTDDYCQKINDGWVNGTGEFAGTLITNPDTAMDEHTKANPCKLNSATIGGLGGKYESSLLGADGQ